MERTKFMNKYTSVFSSDLKKKKLETNLPSCIINRVKNRDIENEGHLSKVTKQDIC